MSRCWQYVYVSVHLLTFALGSDRTSAAVSLRAKASFASDTSCPVREAGLGKLNTFTPRRLPCRTCTWLS